MDVDQFTRGIEEFNRGYFFECHDTLEDLWHGTRGKDRLFLQGLIQIAVGFYHLLNKNYKGATSQFTRGLGKLDQYRPSHRGVDVDAITKSVVGFLALAERGCVTGAEEIDETKIPKIRLTQPITKGE